MTRADWHSTDKASDGVTVELRKGFTGTSVTVWAGDELDPAYLTPAAARELADELPGLLRKFADEAEAADSAAAGA